MQFLRTGYMAIAIGLSVPVYGQIYVTQWNDNTVAKYNLDGSPAANPLISAGIVDPMAVVVDGATLYVSYLGSGSGTGVVASYSTSGATISSSIISGLYAPSSLAVSGSNLYVLTQGTGVANSGALGLYSTSGTPINASLITGITPSYMALSAAGIFITDYTNSTISRYNLDGSGGNTSFITSASGLSGPTFITISGTTIYVANSTTGTIGTYSTIDGSTINASLITGFGAQSGGVSNIDGLMVSGSNLFVVRYPLNEISQYTTDGVSVASSNSTFITSLAGPVGIGQSAIPEPSTCAALAGLATLATAAYRRRRRTV